MAILYHHLGAGCDVAIPVLWNTPDELKTLNMDERIVLREHFWETFPETVSKRFMSAGKLLAMDDWRICVKRAFPAIPTAREKH